MDAGREYRFGVRPRPTEPADLSNLRVVASAVAEHRIIKQLENGTIVVEVGGVRLPVVKPELRAVAVPLGIPLLNGSGGKKNTRQLGAEVIAALRA